MEITTKLKVRGGKIRNPDGASTYISHPLTVVRAGSLRCVLYTEDLTNCKFYSWGTCRDVYKRIIPLR